MGVLTFMAGIIGSIEIYLIPLPFVAFISYVLCASDRFYVRHRRLVAAGGVIVAIAVVCLAMAPFTYPPFQRTFEEDPTGASILGFLLILAGLLALTDAGVLFMRLWQTRKAEKE